jgi:hypothetical protein
MNTVAAPPNGPAPEGEATDLAITAIEAFTRPYDYYYDRYQRYYRAGLRAACRTRGIRFVERPTTRAPWLTRPLRRVRDRVLIRVPGGRAARMADELAHRIEGEPAMPAGLFRAPIGQYLVDLGDGRRANVCIDAADYPDADPDLVEWSDVYFKANLWPTRHYPADVVPLVNGDPLILPRMGALRAHRETPKEFDVCFIARVWGGRDEVEGVEHTLRLLEGLNRARARKVLLGYLVAGDIEAAERRLRGCGIPTTTRPVKPRMLWDLMARSRLNVIRLGMHHCLPWRVAGALAMGACIVLDQHPLSAWPAPLTEGANYLTLAADTSTRATAPVERYEEIPAQIEAWLADEPRLRSIAANNAEYFDRHAHPRRVGEAILDTVEDRLTRSTLS